MFHLAAYQGSAAASTNDNAINGVSDSILKIGASNGFVLQEDMMLLAMYAGGVQLDKPRLKSPKLNQFNPLVPSVFLATEAISSGLNVARFPFRPFVFRNQEEVVALSNNTGAGAQQHTIAAWFSNGIEPIPPGEILTIRGTSTTTATAHAWTQLTYTLDQTLPEGVYALLSSALQSTNAILHRWTFWGQFYRPGFPSTTAFTNQQFIGHDDYYLGLAGRFSNVTLPNIEVFASAGDTSHTFIARVVKVA